MPSKGRKIAVALGGASLGLFGLGGSAWADVAAPTGGSTSSATTPTAPGALFTREARHHGILDHELSGLFVTGLPFSLPSNVTTTASGATTGIQTVNPEETQEATSAQSTEQESEARTTTAHTAEPPATMTDRTSTANPDTTRSDSTDTQSRTSDSQSHTSDSNTSDGQWSNH